ncbi:uncharacterized protein LOC110844913 isoform X2 [Folsomia candida]|nr:uncharacterized protein LOC110844913 isoform X2 [Folsomia candida]
MSSFSQVATDLKHKFKTPYISADTESGFLTVPSSNCGQEKFPFVHEKTMEWKSCDLNKLELCVYNSYYHRQLFFIDGRFQQMMLEMGFSLEDLNQIHSIKRDMDQELWSVMKIDRMAESLKINKFRIILNRFMKMELNLIEDLVAQHERDKTPIKTFLLRNVGKDGQNVVIDLKDLIAWKQHESQVLYMKRISHEETLDVKDVDWLMVEKDMFMLTNRTESAEEMKNIYRFCKSSEYNHSQMSKTELSNLKLLIGTQSGVKGIDWAKVANELGTNRSPIRIFQAYKNFICNTDTNTFMRNYDDKLTAFLHIKQYVGHVPRIVHRLTKKFGPVDLLSFGITWQEINPRFAIGNFYPAEDAALLVVMELHKDALFAGKKFSILQYPLPWRHCNVWRKRAEYLFGNYDKWTFEEDQLLLYSVRKYGLEWKGLDKIFPYRLRNSLPSRYRLLRRKLSNITLAQYHSIYYRRISKSNLLLLSNIINVLRKVIGIVPTKQNGQEVPDISGNIEDEDEDDDDDDDGDNIEMWNDQKLSATGQPITSSTFKLERDWKPLSAQPTTASSSNQIYSASPQDQEDLELLEDILSSGHGSFSKKVQPVQEVCSGWKTPSQTNILRYLKTFDRSIILHTIERLESYINSQQSDARSLLSSSKSAELVLSCDRRKFFPMDPVSVASALQLRRVELKPITSDVWQNLNDFERAVCQAYGAFSSAWRTKKTSARPSLPSELSLSFLPSVKNIIKTPRELACDPPTVYTTISSLPKTTIQQEQYKAIFVPGVTNYNIASTPIDPVIEETSEVQLVVPNATMVEAHNSLCRRVWNNNNSIKTKTRSKKVRRRVLNLAAAKIRWDKEVDKLNLDTAMSQKKEREKKRGLWYDTLLKNYGVEYAGGFEEHLSVNDEHDRLEEMDDTVIEGARLLTVLHDHGYAKGYVESVQTVVDNIRRVVLKSNVSGGDDGDSAKENSLQLQ